MQGSHEIAQSNPRNQCESFPALRRTYFDQALQIFARNYTNFSSLKQRSKGNILVIATKVHWTYSLRLHGHNRLQSVMTETHAAGNGDTKVVDQLLIDISTGDSSVVGSQTSARDNIQTIDSGKPVSRKKSTSETTVRTTTNRSASSTAKGQSADVLKGLNELKDLQRQSLSSMNQMISAMTSAVETFTQVRTSHKKKR